MTDSPSKRLFILDGMALAYRAHFAFFSNPIRNSKGVNTSAVYGFANTLLGILEHEQPTHIAACFDTSAPTERHRIYPDYKANRESMPEELSYQIPLIFKLLEAMNIPILRYDGYEADDTIGTLARLADDTKEFQTYMVSQDKDLGQLISPTCYLWRPGKRGNDHEVIDLEKLKEHWGIERADQVIDILALMGDSSDNIPGLPGVGEKTAKVLIEEFGSVENLLANTDKLKGKRKQIVEENGSLATLSKQLATIDREVPITVTLPELVKKDPNPEELLSLLQELEFRSMQAKLFGKKVPEARKAPLPADDLFAPAQAEQSPEETSSIPAAPVQQNGSGQMDLFEERHLKTVDDFKHEYIIADTEEARAAMIAELEKHDSWCFDTETTGLNPLTDELLGVSFCAEPHKAWYMPVSGPDDLETVRTLLEGSAEKIGHNLKFDLEVLRANGIRVKGPFFDTMLAHALISPGMKHGMDALAESFLQYSTIKLKDIAAPGAKKRELDTSGIPVEVMGKYSAEDADITLQLSAILKKQVKESGMEELFRMVELPLLPVLADMEFSGIRVLPESLEKASVKVGAIIDGLRERIEEAAGHPLNLNSPKQLGDFLFGELELVKKPKKTKTGQFVTDEDTLSALAPLHPIVADILAYRENMKLKSTYLDALPKYICPRDGRIHTQFHQMLTATGRLASQDPNLQNIPVRTEQGRLIRTAFVPASGEYTMLSADYSQIELRIMAALSGDPAMCEAFKEGRDIHTETAAKVYGIPREQVDATMRRAAKMVNFGIIYGISAFGLSQRLGCPRSEAATLIENYFIQFPVVKSFMEDLVHKAEQAGYAETLLGRRRMIPEINSANKTIKSAAERTAINTPIQGTAADMIKIAMIHAGQLLEGTKSRLILQIHDELLVDLHKEETDLIPKIEEAMINALSLPNGVPILVEARTGSNWLEAH
ncbi:DNA polymerase I [uncultured Akkermansia sp.]|uniref:DNA polymerase I n=1 Tax=uncultured Akkermansia sp. TaxID=512294 RepID=UPI00265D552B|nr:DNA polymerase I [uncultured Akkermansia sp.]